MSQSIKAARNALFTALGTIYASSPDTSGAPTLVSFGPPTNYQPQQIVALMSSSRPVERPTMGTNRPRRATVETEVVFSVNVPGGESSQQTAVDNCEDLIALLESYFRTSTVETLGGTCREAWVSNVDGPNIEVIRNQAGAVTGRSADATVTVSITVDY